MPLYLVQKINGFRGMSMECFTCTTWEEVVQRILEDREGDEDTEKDLYKELKESSEKLEKEINEALNKTKKNLDELGVGSFDTSREFESDLEFCCSIVDLEYDFSEDYESQQ